MDSAGSIERASNDFERSLKRLKGASFRKFTEERRCKIFSGAFAGASLSVSNKLVDSSVNILSKDEGTIDGLLHFAVLTYPKSLHHTP